MLRVCLVSSSMRLGVPFIAPRQLGAVESNPGRQFLPSVGWRTGQSGADFFPILAQPTVEDLEPLAHRTLSGAHRTVRCPPSDRWLDHASRADCAADRWLTGQFGAPLDRHCSQSGADCFPKLAQPTVEDLEPLAHRTLSGAHRTVRCSNVTVGSATRHARNPRPTVAPADR